MGFRDNSCKLSLNPTLGGGADRARTGDLLVANQVLSQLSYSPTFVHFVVGSIAAPQSRNPLRDDTPTLYITRLTNQKRDP